MNFSLGRFIPNKTVFFYRRLLSFSLAWFLLNFSISAFSLTMTDEVERYDLGKHVEYVQDTEQEYTAYSLLHEAASGMFIKSDSSVISAGPVFSTFWIKFTLDYQADGVEAKNWLVKAANSQLWDFSLYQLMGERIVHVQTDNHAGEESIHSPHHLMKITLRPGEQKSFLLKFRAYHGSRVDLSVLTPAEHARQSVLEEYLFGIVFGVIISLTLFNLFIYFVVKNKLYLRYVLYSTFAGLFIASNSGHGLIYLWQRIPDVNNLGMILFSYLALSCLIFFFIEFIGTRYYNKAMHRLLLVSAYVTIGMAFITCSFISMWVQVVSGIYAALLLVFILGSCIYYMKNGSKNALLFFCSFSFLAIGSTLNNFARLEIIEKSLVTEYGLYLGFLSELALLSVGLTNLFRNHVTTSLKGSAEQVLSTSGRTRIPFSFDRYRHIYHHRTVGLFSVTDKGELLEANKALLNLLGYETLEGAKESRHRLFTVMPAEIQSAIETGQVSGSLSCAIVMRGGRRLVRDIDYNIRTHVLENAVRIDGSVKEQIEIPEEATI